MTLPVFITVIADHDKPQPSGCLLGFLNNGLNLLGVSSYYQMIVKAVVILLAVLVDNKKQ